MAVRHGDKPGVVVSRIIEIGREKPVNKPVSEPPMGEKEGRIREIRFLLANASVTLSYVKGFDLEKFLSGITLAKESRQDDGIVVVSGGIIYKFYIEDMTTKNLPVSVNKGQRIRLEDGDQVYYLFQLF